MARLSGIDRSLRILAAAGLLLFFAARAQQAPSRLTFDTASIRPTRPGTQNGYIKATPGGLGYIAQNIPIKLMISLMYRVPMRQIQGGPDWLSSAAYDVQAKVDQAYSIDDLHLMYQNLLADRFALKFHKVTRQGPVYDLTIDPSGLKMKPNQAAQDFNIPMTGAPEHTEGVRVPMSYFCWWLGQTLQSDERPVINQTGLDGNFDFVLSFTPPLPPGSPAEGLSPDSGDLPSLFTALREQLGLRLQAQKGPVDYFVIDHIEKPSAN